MGTGAWVCSTSFFGHCSCVMRQALVWGCAARVPVAGCESSSQLAHIVTSCAASRASSRHVCWCSSLGPRQPKVWLDLVSGAMGSWSLRLEGEQAPQFTNWLPMCQTPPKPRHHLSPVGRMQVNVGKVVEELDGLGKIYPFQVPPFFALILRAFSVIEGIALGADPDYAIVRECTPYIARRLLSDNSPRWGQSGGWWCPGAGLRTSVCWGLPRCLASLFHVGWSEVQSRFFGPGPATQPLAMRPHAHSNHRRITYNHPTLPVSNRHLWHTLDRT